MHARHAAAGRGGQRRVSGSSNSGASADAVAPDAALTPGPFSATARAGDGEPQALCGASVDVQPARSTANAGMACWQQPYHPPSRFLFACLCLLPLLLWLLSQAWGMALYSGPRPPGASSSHPLMWFDKFIFRSFGSLLPLLAWLLRWAASFLPRPAQRAAGQRRSSGLGRRSGGSGTPSAAAAAALRHWCAMTLGLETLLLYCAITGARAVLYLGHVYLHQRNVPHLLSDHILLAASLLACFQSELICAASDLQHTLCGGGGCGAQGPAEQRASSGGSGGSGSGKPGSARVVAVAALLALLAGNALLYVLVCMDMHLTARWFHPPREVLPSLAAGLLLFQLPLMAWLCIVDFRARLITCNVGGGAWQMAHVLLHDEDDDDVTCG